MSTTLHPQLASYFWMLRFGSWILGCPLVNILWWGIFKSLVHSTCHREKANIKPTSGRFYPGVCSCEEVWQWKSGCYLEEFLGNWRTIQRSQQEMDGTLKLGVIWEVHLQRDGSRNRGGVGNYYNSLCGNLGPLTEVPSPMSEGPWWGRGY